MLYIGVDLGTSACKFLLVDETGKVCNQVTREYPLSMPHTGWSEQESKEDLSILLSSDVLFDFDSAELTSDADEIIEQVASEIDQSSSETVTIEGYTDNQGPDSVNIPLSQDRAESVESRISDLVTRDDVTFETEGHGSNDPVADNDTAEGQELNRRVTVTFEK